MKKITLAIAMAALVLFAGCKKDKETTGTTIKASIEQCKGDGSKTSIVPVGGEAEIRWTAGDKIVVNNGSKNGTFTLTNGQGTKNGIFTYNGEYTFGSNNIAVYPETAIISGTTVSMTLPATQNLSDPGSFADDANPMWTSFADADDLEFTSLCGVLGLQLAGNNVDITAIEIVSSNATDKLNGAFVADVSETNPQLTPDTENSGTNSIMLNCSTKLTTTAQPFYIVLPVNTLASGFTMKIYNGEAGLIYVRSTTANLNMALNTVKMMDPITVIPGALLGKFTINANGDQVYFSKGNLQYIGSAATPYWKFADHQWEYLGNNGQNSTSQTVDRDLFGWATSGYNHNNHSYQPWETNETQANYYAYNNQALNLWQENRQAEWGYNAISNGGNQENIGWHTLIPARWEYLFYTRTTSSGIRYAKAQVNGVNGMIMLPDDWNTSYYTLNSTNTANAKYNTNVISLENWNNVLEPHGAVFLPDAGIRVGTTISTAISCYWTSDQFYSYQNKDQCCNLWMHNTGFSFATMERYKGASVRLVIDAN